MEDYRDNFFAKLKSKFDEGDHPFREEDWALLEPRLQKHRDSVVLILIGISLFMVLGLAMVGFWYSNVSNSSNRSLALGVPKNEKFPFNPNHKTNPIRIHSTPKIEAGNGLISKNSHSEPSLEIGLGDPSQKNSLKLSLSSPNSHKTFQEKTIGLKGSRFTSSYLNNKDKEEALDQNNKRQTKNPGKGYLGLVDPFPKMDVFNPTIFNPSISPKRPPTSCNGAKTLIRVTGSLPLDTGLSVYRLGGNGLGDKGLSSLAGDSTNLPIFHQEPGSLVEVNLKPMDSLSRSIAQVGLPNIQVLPLTLGGDDSLLPKKTKGDKIRNKPDYYWILSALASPDFNSVNSLNSSGVGINYGIRIAYNLSDRWKISAGLLYGPKLYLASSSDYQNSAFPKTWSSISSIKANCKVWDIPLEIGYSFYKRYRSQFYMDLGVSTYFMHEETYTLNYIPGSINPKTGLVYNPYTYNIYDINKNILSVLDFELEYHYRISDRSYFGLSPYLKLPITGVGQGALKLISLGTSISLNFSLGKSH